MARVSVKRTRTDEPTRKPALEAEVSHDVRLALSAEGCALWRNNVGLALHEGRRVAYGLQKGSADLVGIAPGGRFLSVETKRAKGGIAAHEQELWMLLVRQRGGIAMITTSAEDAVAQLRTALGSADSDPALLVNIFAAENG